MKKRVPLQVMQKNGGFYASISAFMACEEAETWTRNSINSIINLNFLL